MIDKISEVGAASVWCIDRICNQTPFATSPSFLDLLSQILLILRIILKEWHKFSILLVLVKADFEDEHRDGDSNDDKQHDEHDFP